MTIIRQGSANETCSASFAAFGVWADLIVCVPDTSPPSLVWAVYSYIPPLMAVGVAFWMVLRRTSTSALAFAFGIGTVALNETILKRLVPQPRPSLACVCTLGMPSGHSMVAAEFLTWLLLETIFPPIHQRPRRARQKVGLLILAVILLVPVPASRVVLHYHTVEQALAGVFLGVILGALWFLLLALSHRHGVLDRCFASTFLSKRLSHTYRRPSISVHS